jgi:hypothetical protein
VESTPNGSPKPAAPRRGFRLRKNAAERVRVSLHEFSGHDMLSMRVYVGQDVGQAKPTQKGLTVNVATLPKLIGLLQEAEAKARAEGLI